jgi:predicted RNA-binding Zn ribbon-like protein
LRRIHAHGEEFDWEWEFDESDPEQALAPIACSAAELLASSDLLHHLRRCEGDNCGWLFLDSSRNHSRRWCDMRDCGNRAKVRRHRQKHPEK